VAVRPIVLYPDPVLLEETQPVESIDEDVRKLVTDLVETMYRAPGIGLAANQIGVSRRVCVVDPSVGEEPGALRVFINPLVRELHGRERGEEGCLSFPGITLEIDRAEQVTVESLDLEGRQTTQTFEGLLARVILHECEHLDGRVFLHNLSPLKRELVKKQIRKRIQAGDWVEMVAQ
jgi:peptide deformylase